MNLDGFFRIVGGYRPNSIKTAGIREDKNLEGIYIPRTTPFGFFIAYHTSFIRLIAQEGKENKPLSVLIMK
jgi:hypothetical protein